MPVQGTDAEQLAFVMRVLRITGDADLCEDVYWRCDSAFAPVTFFVGCNDVFWWGTSDAEEITPANVGVLEQSVADVRAATGDDYGLSVAAELFVARVRGLRPQGAIYRHYSGRLWPLFDACGPEREVTTGNTPKPEAPVKP